MHVINEMENLIAAHVLHYLQLTFFNLTFSQKYVELSNAHYLVFYQTHVNLQFKYFIKYLSTFGFVSFHGYLKHIFFIYYLVYSKKYLFNNYTYLTMGHSHLILFLQLRWFYKYLPLITNTMSVVNINIGIIYINIYTLVPI